ncbi:hypothetical protein DFP72DRAFT_1049541 [Ephemerocybe angulata]|uniref:Uncharacterized protein n=1 Tax=Ephemerocybe angulata TaxID=980116 RepID=A0A8H6M1V3_9AGAR|nr:hypothetical protein DFP72DRAFT_1049541 [Tulosesus angulatus]
MNVVRGLARGTSRIRQTPLFPGSQEGGSRRPIRPQGPTSSSAIQGWIYQGGNLYSSTVLQRGVFKISTHGGDPVTAPLDSFVTSLAHLTDLTFLDDSPFDETFFDDLLLPALTTVRQLTHSSMSSYWLRPPHPSFTINEETLTNPPIALPLLRAMGVQVPVDEGLGDGTRFYGRPESFACIELAQLVESRVRPAPPGATARLEQLVLRVEPTPRASKLLQRLPEVVAPFKLEGLHVEVSQMEETLGPFVVGQRVKEYRHWDDGFLDPLDNYEGFRRD